MDSSWMLAGTPGDEAAVRSWAVLPAGRSDWRRCRCIGPSPGGASVADDDVLLCSDAAAFSFSVHAAEGRGGAAWCRQFEEQHKNEANQSVFNFLRRLTT